jgi:hypothetical protein
MWMKKAAGFPPFRLPSCTSPLSSCKHTDHGQEKQSARRSSVVNPNPVGSYFLKTKNPVKSLRFEKKRSLHSTKAFISRNFRNKVRVCCIIAGYKIIRKVESGTGSTTLRRSFADFTWTLWQKALNSSGRVSVFILICSAAHLIRYFFPIRAH